MSYGRYPYYIYSDGQRMTFMGDNGLVVQVPEDALAQWLVSMCWRGQEEINEWVERGKRIRPTIDNFELTYMKREQS